MIRDPLHIFVKDFGDDITVNGGTPFKGNFDEAYTDNNLGEQVIGQGQPRFTCVASLVANVERGMPCVVKGKTYSVLQVEPDGTGMAVVVLSYQT